MHALLLLAALALGATDLEDIEHALKFGDWNGRIHAVHRLETKGVSAVPLLERASRDADWQVRLAAVHYLGRLGVPAMKQLAAALRREPCRHVRLAGAHWLGSLGPEAAPLLDELSADDGPMMRLTAGYWRGKNEGTTYVAGPGELEGARRVDLRECHSSETAGPGLEDAPAAPAAPEPEPATLNLPSSAPTEEAAKPEPEPALPPAVEARHRELDALLGEEPQVAALDRGKPALSPLDNPLGLPEDLARLRGLDGRPAPEPAPAERLETSRAAAPKPKLARPLGDKEKLPSSAGLAERGPSEHQGPGLAAAAGKPKPEHDALPALLEALKSSDRRKRARAADELGRRGAVSAVGPLSKLLADKDARVRASAALALGNMGDAAAAAVPLLVKALDDGHEEVEWSAAVALGRLGSSEGTRAFRRHLRGRAGKAVAAPR